ncbi:hypothetical protein CJ030_MR6G016558 [Morella rubra]|uniref:Uncharacterized protein n=1 Tax=Morella rubra TaxID=262757 RepID=A0A6A1V906_9ROSI|nr:hypothetical protein CJ030_MR6G016558 [Morella rubra]
MFGYRILPSNPIRNTLISSSVSQSGFGSDTESDLELGQSLIPEPPQALRTSFPENRSLDTHPLKCWPTGTRESNTGSENKELIESFRSDGRDSYLDMWKNAVDRERKEIELKIGENTFAWRHWKSGDLKS